MANEADVQKQAKVTETKETDGKVVLNKTIKVYGTGKGPMAKDKVYEIHPIHAETIIKKGFATKTAPKK